jgi:hypothetical protein
VLVADEGFVHPGEVAPERRKVEPVQVAGIVGFDILGEDLLEQIPTVGIQRD